MAGPAHATLSAFPGWQGAKLLAALSQHTFWVLVMRADLGVQPGMWRRSKGDASGRRRGRTPRFARCWLTRALSRTRDGVTLAPVPGSGEPGVSFGVHAAQALREGVVDGFWANAMGAEVSVRSGIGSLVLDPRQGLGPPGARDYTFAALVTTDRLIEESPATAEGAVRAIVEAQRVLRADPSQATEVGQRLFPPDEAALIEDLVRRDAPYYTAGISRESVSQPQRVLPESWPALGRRGL